MPHSSIELEETSIDIIGREPAWIVQSGIGTIALILVFITSITWFIKYPDTIESAVTLQASEAPIPHFSSLSGNIDALLVNDGQLVKKGQRLAVVESQADYTLIKQLDALLTQQINADNFGNLKARLALLHSRGNAGSLSASINHVVENILLWQQVSSARSLQQQRVTTASLEQQYASVIAQLSTKLETTKQQIDISKVELKQKQELAEQNVVSKLEVAQKEQAHLALVSTLNDILISIETYQVKTNELHHSQNLAEISHEEQLNIAHEKVVLSYLSLLHQFEAWKSQHLVTAKIFGTVSFSQNWHVNQRTNTQEPLLNIVPSSGKMDAWMKVPTRGVGKIQSGQKVLISLHKYPSVEFGVIEATVKLVNIVPDEEGYLVTLTLPDTLISSYGKRFSNDTILSGDAKIITQPNRLLTKFIEKITYSFQ